MITSQLQWILCAFSFQFISYTHEARLPRVHLASPDLIEEAMLLGLEMGLARDNDNSHQIFKKKDNPGPLWFGPRLGRRKRSLEDEEDRYDERGNDLEEEENEEGINDLLRTSPWAIIPLRAKSSVTYRNTANFTPRPGRSLSEEDDYSGSRSPPFAPRLGRDRGGSSSLWRITPRPGRQVLRSDQDPRIKRSVH